MRWKPACLRPAVAAERALSSAAVATESSLHLLFVVFDAGESNLLKPVVEAIATLKLWSVGVLVLGEPATTIFKDSPCMRSLDSLGVKTKALNGKDDPSRTQLLSESDLELVRAGLGPVEVVVSGMAYAMQAQVAGAWSASPTPPCAVVGVVDNWAKWSEASFPAEHFVIPAVTNVILAPSPLQTSAIREAHPEVRVAAVGHPSMMQWRLAAGNVGLVRRIGRVLYGDRCVNVALSIPLAREATCVHACVHMGVHASPPSTHRLRLASDGLSHHHECADICAAQAGRAVRGRVRRRPRQGA